MPRTRNRKTAYLFIAAAVLLLAVSVCSLMLGSVNLPFSRIAAAFSGNDSIASVILFDLRLPRLMAAMLAGIGLSIAGMLLQTVTNNDLCAPNVIGVNAGAGFFVMLMLCLMPKQWRLLPAAAFVGAILTTMLVLGISRINGNRTQKTTLVLAGVAISTLMNAGIAFLSLKYPEVLTSYTAFSVGGFTGVSMKQLAVPAVIIGVLFVISLFIAPKVHLMCLGDDMASSLGVNVKLLRIAAIAIASGLCAAVVSFAGLLGFAGLVVPHIVRRIISGDFRVRLWMTALCGALIVSISDLAGRT
ncbi:MAG: iron ABC transporter permease, partial [Parasporobacterium sp.]|nr:iron ABC transporter permease [Parasporobacterium sp.]